MQIRRKWLKLGSGFFLVILLTVGFFWYEPWRASQSDYMVQALQSTDANERQEAITELFQWRLLQRQPFLVQSQSVLLTSYEHAINNTLVKGEWRRAQLWLQDLQRLYPQLPAAQSEQLKVSSYIAQQINVQIGRVNQILETHRFLTPSALAELGELQIQLKELSPDNALIDDKRIMYALLLSIDEALVENNFKLAQVLLDWGMERFPDEPELNDRAVQVNYQIGGRPAEVLTTCISEGRNCWEITQFPPLFSQPWVIQNGAEHPWLVDWNMSAIIQFELGSYYRRHALQAYAQRQFMQATVDLLRASYFNPPAELSEYWQWLAYAFIEREQSEYKASQLAQMSALQHTLLTQVAALDVVGAQNTVVSMQTMGADPWFVDQVALPMLGDAYLKLAQQLANAEQYELAMRLLITGEQFLPQNEGIQQLLVEYKQSTPNFSEQSMEPISDTPRWDIAAMEALGFEKPSLQAAAMTDHNNPCAVGVSALSPNNVYVCQDSLSSQKKGPLLIIPPPSKELANSYAISKYPISIREYNDYCNTTKACELKRLPTLPVSKSKKDRAAIRTEGLDLSDVQDVMQDYEQYCKSAGTCNTVEPHGQDLPVTDITLAEAAAYMNWLSKATGYTYRLPTVVEWRYAILSDEIYRCTPDTLLKLPKKLRPVQQGNTNRWGIVYQLSVLQEWVQTPGAIGAMGPEHPENLPVCSLPAHTDPDSRKASDHMGFRVVREM